MGETSIPERCELCREDVRDRLAQFDHRLLAPEIIVRAHTARTGIDRESPGGFLEEPKQKFAGTKYSLPGRVTSATTVTP
jgi:hypothetical protein